MKKMTKKELEFSLEDARNALAEAKADYELEKACRIELEKDVVELEKEVKWRPNEIRKDYVLFFRFHETKEQIADEARKGAIVIAQHSGLVIGMVAESKQGQWCYYHFAEGVLSSGAMREIADYIDVFDLALAS